MCLVILSRPGRKEANQKHRYFSAYLQSIITEEPSASLRSSALGSPGSTLELAGTGSSPQGSSFWSHLTDTNPEAALPPNPCHTNQIYLLLQHIKETSTYFCIYSGSPYQTKKMPSCSPLMQALLLFLDNSQSGGPSPSHLTSPASHIKIPEENKMEKCSQLQNVLISC